MEFEIEAEDQDLGAIIIKGEVEWTTEDNSFDYAGTHCTWGQSGTHKVIDVVPESITIDSIECEQGKNHPKSFKEWEELLMIDYDDCGLAYYKPEISEL